MCTSAPPLFHHRTHTPHHFCRQTRPKPRPEVINYTERVCSHCRRRADSSCSYMVHYYTERVRESCLFRRYIRRRHTGSGLHHIIYTHTALYSVHGVPAHFRYYTAGRFVRYKNYVI